MKNDYPAAEERPTLRTIGGVTFDDPYAWLEEDNEETLSWQQRQDALAHKLLRQDPFDAMLRQLGKDYVDVFTAYAPRPAGGLWFHRDVPAGQRHAVIRVSDDPVGKGKVLIDLNDQSHAARPVLFEMVPSRDGTKLLVTTSKGGGMHDMAAAIVDTGTGAQIATIASPMVIFPTWLPDGDTILFMSMGSKRLPDGTQTAGSAIFQYEMATGKVEQLDLDISHPAAWPTVSPDGAYALIHINQTSPRPAYIRSLKEPTGWRPFLRDREGLFKGTIAGDAYVAINNDGAPRGRIISIPLANPEDEGSWVELVPESDEKLAALSVLGNRLLLAYFRDASAGLRLLHPDGTLDEEIALPGAGAVGKSPTGHILSIMDDVTWSDGEQIAFVYSSLTTSPASFRYSVDDRRLQLISPPSRRLPAKLELRRARNGDVDVPYRVFALEEGSGPRPTIVTGYGGYNVPWLPFWFPLAAAWVELGGVWIHAHLAGGGEFGDEWWQRGRRESKRNTFEDLFAVAEDVVASGIATPGLGVWGSSNGGLLAGAATTFRPDLFRAAILQVPLLDALGYARDPQSYAIGLADYGDPANPDDACFLAKWSPYQNLRKDVAYPAVLLDAGAEDQSCPPWHSRKFAAFLQSLGGDRRVLLRVRTDSGHNSMALQQMIERDAEELSFFATELGLNVDQRK